MRNRLVIVFILSSGIGWAGCGEPPPPPPPKDAPTVGPHHGTAFALPQDAGLAEVVNEPEPEGRSDPVTSIVVYFLMPDGKTPLTPAPTDVRVVVSAGRKKPETLELKAEPKSDDPSGGARFASKTGPYLLPDLHGQLSAKVGGAEFKASLVGVR